MALLSAAISGFKFPSFSLSTERERVISLAGRLVDAMVACFIEASRNPAVGAAMLLLKVGLLMMRERPSPLIDIPHCRYVLRPAATSVSNSARGTTPTSYCVSCPCCAKCRLRIDDACLQHYRLLPSPSSGISFASQLEMHHSDSDSWVLNSALFPSLP